MKYIFVAKHNDDYGLYGWVLQSNPDYDAYPGGTIVAHDTIEHFPMDRGEIHEELLALGASLWIRGETGYYQRNGNIHLPYAHLASDIPNIFAHALDEGFRFLKPPPTRKLSEEIEYQLRKFKRAAERELVDREIESYPIEWLDWATDWLRRGYRRAQKRWPDNYRACDLFDQISKDKKMECPEPGDVVILTLNPKTYSVDIRRTYER